MNREELTDLIVKAKHSKGFTWKYLAEYISKPTVWTVSALMGQHPFSEDEATQICALLEIDSSCVPMLTRIPMRGSLPSPVPVDPTIYRFYEAIQVYGPAIKEMIHEEFGDGIMSAINFSVSVDKKQDPTGDRVVVTMSGKFLAYEWKE